MPHCTILPTTRLPQTAASRGPTAASRADGSIEGADGGIEGAGGGIDADKIIEKGEKRKKDETKDDSDVTFERNTSKEVINGKEHVVRWRWNNPKGKPKNHLLQLLHDKKSPSRSTRTACMAYRSSGARNRNRKFPQRLGGGRRQGQSQGGTS